MAKYCAECGYAIEENWRNCPKCGSVLKPINQQTTRPVSTQNRARVIKEELVSARKFLLDGNYKQGIRYCKSIKKQLGGKSDFWIILGELYHFNDQFEKAIKSFEIAYIQNPGESSILLKLVESYLKIGNINRAGICCARAVSVGELSEGLGRKFGEICADPLCEPQAMLEIIRILENSGIRLSKFIKLIEMIKKIIAVKATEKSMVVEDVRQMIMYIKILEALEIPKLLKKVEKMKKGGMAKDDIRSLKDGINKYIFLDLAFTKKERYSSECLKNLISLVTILFKKKEFQEAYMYCCDAVQIADQLKDTKNSQLLLNLKAQLMNVLGSKALTNYYYYDALIQYKGALQISSELKNDNLIALTLNYLGLVYLAMKDYDQALEKCMKALEIIEISPKLSNKAIILHSIGKIYYKLGNYNKASECFQQAHEIAKDKNSPVLIAVSLHNIGKVYHKNGDNSQALNLFNNALRILNEHGLANHPLAQKVKNKITFLNSKVV